MPEHDFQKIITILQKERKTHNAPAITLMAENGDSAFKILIATILSLRTRDQVTIEASRKLFKKGHTVHAVHALSEKEIERLIYPVGFYKVKAKNIKKICKLLILQHDSNVPSTMEELLSLPGVGRKTANLVLAKGFNIPAICVDIHVHRILNRIGFLKTKTPEETEMKLREQIPENYWIPINDVFVAHGQVICTPQSPWCSKCAIYDICERKKINTSR